MIKTHFKIASSAAKRNTILDKEYNKIFTFKKKLNIRRPFDQCCWQSVDTFEYLKKSISEIGLKLKTNNGSGSFIFLIQTVLNFIYMYIQIQ